MWSCLSFSSFLVSVVEVGEEVKVGKSVLCRGNSSEEGSEAGGAWCLGGTDGWTGRQLGWRPGSAGPAIVVPGPRAVRSLCHGEQGACFRTSSCKGHSGRCVERVLERKTEQAASEEARLAPGGKDQGGGGCPLGGTSLRAIST